MTLPVNNIGAPAASATLPEETGSLSQIRTFEPVANKKRLDLWQKPGPKAKRSSGHGVEASSRLKDLITLLPMRIVPGQTIDVTRGPAPSPTGPLRGTPLPMRFPVPLEPYKPRFSLPFRSAFTVDVEPKSIGGSRPIGNSQVAQATGSTLDASQKLSLAQLRDLNPLAKPADHRDAAGWAKMFDNSNFTAPIEGMTGAVTTTPVSLGGALSIPAGTKISDANGIQRSTASFDSFDRPPSLQFELPGGSKLVLTPEVDKQTGLQMTRLTFDDGRFLRFIGTPFFNPKTGTLTRLQQVANTPDAPQYQMRASILGESLATFPARNGAISGKDAEAALRSSLR